MKKPDNVNFNELYTIPQTCKLLGIDRRTLQRWTASGGIKSAIRKCDGKVVYSGAAIHNCYYATI